MQGLLLFYKAFKTFYIKNIFHKEFLGSFLGPIDIILGLYCPYWPMLYIMNPWQVFKGLYRLFKAYSVGCRPIVFGIS
jgi:hypothetical protein